MEMYAILFSQWLFVCHRWRSQLGHWQIVEKLLSVGRIAID